MVIFKLGILDESAADDVLVLEVLHPAWQVGKGGARSARIEDGHRKKGGGGQQAKTHRSCFRCRRRRRRGGVRVSRGRVEQGKRRDHCPRSLQDEAYISALSRSSSLSIGWSTGVSISGRDQEEEDRSRTRVSERTLRTTRTSSAFVFVWRTHPARSSALPSLDSRHGQQSCRTAHLQ